MFPLWMIGAGLGGAQAGLGIFSALQGNAARQQEYKNQLAQQRANERFAKWQAEFNLRNSNETAKLQYWAQTVQYNQDLAYTKSLRNFELLKEINQADVVRQTRVAAAGSFISDSAAITQAAQEASIQDAVATMQYSAAALQARGRLIATGQEGLSFNQLIDDYARQAGDFETIQQINAGFRKRQYTRQQAAQVVEYLNQYNSQQFYQGQKYMDPIRPYPPLPALLAPAQPSFTGTPPSRAAMGLEIGSAVLGGAQTGFNVYSGLMNTGRPKPKE